MPAAKTERPPALPVPEKLAARLGLRVQVYEYDNQSPPLWLVRHAGTGRDLGTWVPKTGSLWVHGTPARVVGVTTAKAALTLFALKVRTA